ncbi:MAG: retroviral-like aspartic protease family protein [Abditibacteriales bacterium]|nr:retroviral-like aspartic protease family protein [Abditibacteriales bacterium]MDW8367526.1 retropepsin-like aspartic protease [Abditibacteriales bacterium]
MAILRFNPNANALVFQALVSDGRVVGLDMIVDTGASGTTIPLSVVQRLSLAASTTQPSSAVTTAQGVTRVPLFTLPRLDALGQQVRNLDVIGLDLPPTAGAHGLLGLNFLRSFILVINFPKGKLALLQANAHPLQRWRGFIELLRVYW